MPQVKLNTALKRIEISNVEIESELAFSYFQSLPESERDAALIRAFNIGVLALHQDRLAAFLARTKNELGTELESLKIMFDLNAEIYSKSSVKGGIGEAQIAEFLSQFLSDKGIKDSVELTGNNAGVIPKNKTGDIVCNLDDEGDRRVVIECKFDKSVPLGEIQKRDWYGNNLDTAWSQLIEAKANRDADEAIIVLDRSSINPALLKSVENIAYIPKVGFIVVIDSLRNDYQNLGAAYLVARSLATANPAIDCDNELLLILIERVLADIRQMTEIRKLVQQNITISKSILVNLERSQIAIEFTQQYLTKFLSDGTLSKQDLLDFYSGGDVKRRFLAIESSISALVS